jgi:hypothetical protein
VGEADALAIWCLEGLNLNPVVFKLPGIEPGLIPSWTVDEHKRCVNDPEHLRKTLQRKRTMNVLCGFRDETVKATGQASQTCCDSALNPGHWTRKSDADDPVLEPRGQVEEKYQKAVDGIGFRGAFSVRWLQKGLDNCVKLEELFL